jgi:serine/threonine-protein kinase
MSPEQVRSSRTVDARSDIWSLAVILFEALAGHPPFHGSMTATAAAIVADKTPSLCSLRPDIPVELEAALGKALEKHPNRRYQDVQELSAALAPFGPPRMPSTGLSDPSIPSFPSGPSSNPSLGGNARIVPPTSDPRLSEANAASETVLIPPEERGGSAGDVRRDKPQRLGAILAGAGVVAMILVAGTVAALRRPAPTVAAPVPPSTPSAATTTAPSAAADPSPVSPPPTSSPPPAEGPSPALAESAAPHPAPSSLLPIRAAPTPGYSSAPHPPNSAPHRTTPPPPATARPPPPPANPTYL